jgi:hypothetical protein
MESLEHLVEGGLEVLAAAEAPLGYQIECPSRCGNFVA